MSNRIETGPVQFEDDWTGIFIRGDNAMALLFSLNHPDILSILEKNPIKFSRLRWLKRLLSTCNMSNELRAKMQEDYPDIKSNYQDEIVQELKTYKDCIRNKE